MDVLHKSRGYRKYSPFLGAIFQTTCTVSAQVLSREETSSRTSSVSLLDGSYLNLAASQQPRVHRRCGAERAPGPTCCDPSPRPRCASPSSPAGRAARCPTAGCDQPRSESKQGCLRCRRRCERCDDARLESGHRATTATSERCARRPQRSSRCGGEIS